MNAEYYVERQRLNKPKNMKEFSAKKSLSYRYAEVVKLRQAVCQTQAELRAPTGLNRLASK